MNLAARGSWYLYNAFIDIDFIKRAMAPFNLFPRPFQLSFLLSHTLSPSLRWSLFFIHSFVRSFVRLFIFLCFGTVPILAYTDHSLSIYSSIPSTSVCLSIYPITDPTRLSSPLVSIFSLSFAFLLFSRSPSPSPPPSLSQPRPIPHLFLALPPTPTFRLF